MASFNETSTGVWEVSLTNREKKILEIVRAVDPQRFPRLVEDFFSEAEAQAIKSKFKVLQSAYKNASSATQDQVDTLLGV